MSAEIAQICYPARCAKLSHTAGDCIFGGGKAITFDVFQWAIPVAVQRKLNKQLDITSGPWYYCSIVVGVRLTIFGGFTHGPITLVAHPVAWFNNRILQRVERGGMPLETERWGGMPQLERFRADQAGVSGITVDSYLIGPFVFS